jgi:hypothetical protein
VKRSLVSFLLEKTNLVPITKLDLVGEDSLKVKSGILKKVFDFLA